MTGPLAGVRVLEYAQYVAGPFAGMLLADLGADVVKVESPAGDAWRRYEPFADGESRYFYSLNRNKRSVVIDLKDVAGRAANQALLAGADVVIHNLPPDRARRFGLDREAVRAANPRAVWCCVSAFGSDGPDAGRTAYDLIAQAASGLLLADARPGDDVPRRAGDIALADFTAGLLTAIAALAGLAGRDSHDAPGVEVSLLGAALAVQTQRFVAVEAHDDVATNGLPAGATPAELAERARSRAAAAALEPYYRTYRTADGFLALACLNHPQRLAVLGVLGVADAWAGNPQAEPADAAERRAREATVERVAARLRHRATAEWLDTFRARGVPASAVLSLERLFAAEQAHANGLVQTVQQPGVGPVRLLGNVFKVDGASAPARRPAPGLGQHTAEVLQEGPR